MSQSRYRALRVVLGFLSLVLAIGGMFMILSDKPLIMRMFMHPPESEISTLLLATLKEMGALALMVSVMLFLASRDPGAQRGDYRRGQRGPLHTGNHASRVSLYVGRGGLYPTYLILGRPFMRLALAGLIYYLRPRELPSKPVEEFLKNAREAGERRGLA